MTNESKEFKASIVYVIVGFINKGIGIITVPVFTRLLTTEEMGTVTTWISWMTILLPIASLSVASSSLIIAMNKFKTSRDQYESSTLCLSTLSSLICAIVYFLFRKQLNSLFTLTTPLMLFMILYLTFSPGMEMWMVRQRYEYNIKNMAIVTLISNLSSALIGVIFVLLLNNSGINLGNVRIYAAYTILILFGVFFYFKILKTGRTVYNSEYWKFALKVSVPLIFHTLAKNILDVSDRTMISMYCGKSAAGIYGTIYSISSLSLIVWNSINNAFIPYLYERLETNSKNDVAIIKKIANIVLLVYAVACIGLTAIAPEIVHILTTEDYYDAVYIIPALSAGIFLTSVYNLFADVILYHKKSTIVMCATIVATIVNVILNTIFIQLIGYQAAAYTTLVSFIVLAISQYVAMKKVHKKDLYNVKFMFIISTLVLIACISFNFVYNYTIIRYLIIVAILVCVLLFWKNVKSTMIKLRKKEF